MLAQKRAEIARVTALACGAGFAALTRLLLQSRHRRTDHLIDKWLSRNELPTSPLMQLEKLSHLHWCWYCSNAADQASWQ